MGNGENMVNAGISFALDRTNHISNSRTALAREVIDLRAQVAEMKAMLANRGLSSIDEDKLKLCPDIPENHWAYEYVDKLAAAGIIEGYPDGNFNGDRMMSRYEFAAMLYHAMQNGAQLDSKIINEFMPEMGRIRVDRISGKDGGMLKVEKKYSKGEDIGYVGEVTDVDTTLLDSLLKDDFLPVICPIGYDDDFHAYNINADDAACAIARAVNAEKLAFLTDIEGVYKDFDDKDSLISELSTSEARTLLESGTIGGGMLPKLNNCIDAIEHGVSRVHILDGRIPHCLLLEIFTNKGVGTAILSDDAEKFFDSDK